MQKLFRVKTRRLGAFFEPFTGSVALTRPEKFPCKATCNPVVLAREFRISARRESVNTWNIHQLHPTALEQPNLTLTCLVILLEITKI